MNSKAVKFLSALESSGMRNVVRLRCGREYGSRRGIATFWLLLFVPVFLVLLGLVVNVANLWLARVELEDALESAALAAVKEWVENPSTPDPTTGPRAAGIAYAAANTVRGQPVSLLPGEFLFGAVYQEPSGCIVFDGTVSPDCNADPIRHPGVLVQAVTPVPTLWSNLLGHYFAAGHVTTYTIAVYPCGPNQQPQLIWANKVITP